MRVDPPGLAAAAQRILGAVSDLTGGDPLHPPLAPDDTSCGAAARLSAAATTLAATIDAQAAALVTTAQQLHVAAAGFTDREALNTDAIASLADATTATVVSGWAPSPPADLPDVRPPLAAPTPMPGEMIASKLDAGMPAAGEQFIAAWLRLAGSLQGVSDLVHATAAQLPDTWDSQLATPPVRSHLDTHADGLSRSAMRARALARQAGVHAGQYAGAVADVPVPALFRAVDQRLHAVSQANAASGGKLSGAVATVLSQKAALETQAQQAYSVYRSATEATTAADPDALNAGVTSGADAAPSRGSEAQFAAMLPTALGAAEGLVGGALSVIGKAPETVAQFGAQAAGAATQSLSSLVQSGASEHHRGGSEPGAPGGGRPAGGGPGDPGSVKTAPAAGAAPILPAVMPATGPAAGIPGMPAGRLPPPVESSAPAAPGVVPMGMPMGAMMPPGTGAGGERAARPKKVVVPATPHTESVTGKVSMDRLAKAISPVITREPEPPGDDPQPPYGTITRRVVMPEDRP